MIKNYILSALFLSFIIGASSANGQQGTKGITESPIDAMLKVNMNELSDSERRSIVRIFDEMGSIPMTRLDTRETTQVMPGSLTAKEGLDFIPDQEDAVDTYMTLIEQGVLPFAAIFLTNEAILSAMQETNDA